MVCLGDLHREECGRRADRAALIGYHLAATVNHADDVEEWCQDAMSAAIAGR